MIEPGQNQIRDLCTEQSYQRGVRYFLEGRVKIIDASASRIVATVIGTQSYRVEVDLDSSPPTATVHMTWKATASTLWPLFWTLTTNTRKSTE